ncbi:MAG: LON peptidase substrate-binding domain-containing protein [Betaproteobacteria bacterium]|nr:LON peptidase substrate-binding domain-containing protein [Betaproteobacteria bacterium]
MELPLFPLNTLLLPGGHLRLKAFEPRYLDLVTDSLRSGAPFGICLIRFGPEVGEVAQPEPVGTLAHIRKADMHEPDVFDLEIEGGDRFRIQSTRTGPNRLLIGEVDVLPPESSAPVPEHCAVCLRLLRRMAEELPELAIRPVRDEVAWVGHRLVELLPFEMGARQAMLELEDPVRRLEIIVEFVREQGWREEK